MTGPPGPPLPTWIQSLLLWRYWPRFTAACQRRYGDVFAVRIMAAGTVVYLADPEDVKTVFAGSEAVYHGGEAGAPLKGLLGASSLLVLDGDVHRVRRKAMMPGFQRGAVVRQSEVMAEVAADHVIGWPAGKEFAVLPKVSEIALELILRTVIGATDPARLAGLRRALRDILDTNVLAFVAVIRPELQRVWPWRSVGRRIAYADELLYAEIADRRDDPGLGERTDVLATLIRAGAEDGAEDGIEPLTDEVLRDQLMTLLIAGHDTTTASLSWLFERLVRHPQVLLRAEHAARSEQADGEAYLDAVVNEALRVRPVIFDVRRILTEPRELHGYSLPAGTMVAPCAGLIHRDERFHRDPDRFDPDRMLMGAPPPNAWLPFGGGGRRCLGATYSQVTMRVVVREVLRRWDLQPSHAPDEQAAAKHAVFAPAHGGLITVARPSRSRIGDIRT